LSLLSQYSVTFSWRKRTAGTTVLHGQL